MALRLIIAIMTLNILCWNVRGIMSSTLCLNLLLDKLSCDIAFISEHKLQPYNKCFMDSIHSNYLNVTACADTWNNENNSYYHGKAGVSILYKKHLISQSFVIAGVGLNLWGAMNRQIYLFAIYMPSDNDILSYRQ